MIHPSTEVRFVSKEIGYGVFATDFIPRGTITFAQDPLDIEITQKKYNKLNEQDKFTVDKYSFIDEKGNYVVSWDNAKYMNHSCNPNTMSTGYGFEIALRDIRPNDELTDEYGLFNIQETIQLHCNCPSCRHYLKPTDIDEYSPIWDEKVKFALENFSIVQQPLLKLLPQQVLKDVNLYLSNKKPYKSVKSLKYVPKVLI